MNETEKIRVHPFEARGLGKAPFRYVGIEPQEIRNGQRVLGSVGGCTIETKPGGTCAYCGQYIVNMFNVESADGRTFHVGCDCIFKVNDPSLTKAVSAAQKGAKRDRDEARIQAAREALSTAYALRAKPHPSPYHAEQGKTLADYCEWLLSNGGVAGKLRAARLIELSMAPRTED